MSDSGNTNYAYQHGPDEDLNITEYVNGPDVKRVSEGYKGGKSVYISTYTNKTYGHYKTEIYNRTDDKTITREGYNYGGDDGFGSGFALHGSREK